MEQAPPQSNPQPPPPPSSSTPTAATDVSSPALPPPAPTSLPLPYPSPTPTPTPQVRPGGIYGRPWPPQPQQLQQQQLPPPSSHYSHSHFSSPPAPNQRGGMAIGVPAAAHLPGAPNPTGAHVPPPPFASHTQPYAAMARNVPDSGPSSSPQVRQVMGPLGPNLAMLGASHQHKPVQSSPRPQSNPNIQSPVTQNFQGHGMLRVPATGSSGSPSPGSSQGLQAHTQPWLNGGNPQARPPLPSNRPQMGSQTQQQRPQAPQQQRPQAPPQLQNSASATSQQQQVSQAQQSQQPSSSGHQEHHGPQFSQSRVQQSIPNQPQVVSRSPSLGTQRAPQAQAVIPSTAVQSSLPSRAAISEPEEPCSRILRKRCIQELVSQVDPSEKLDPDVEDILVDIAEDFVESITSFGCSLAKHRKSSTLEAKDILLHLERNWNVTLPGFSGDEIKTYKKPVISDIHKERLAVVKKSIIASETANSKSIGGNPKGHVAKGPNSLVGSPPAKVREAA